MLRRRFARWSSICAERDGTAYEAPSSQLVTSICNRDILEAPSA